MNYISSSPCLPGAPHAVHPSPYGGGGRLCGRGPGTIEVWSQIRHQRYRWKGIPFTCAPLCVCVHLCVCLCLYMCVYLCVSSFVCLCVHLCVYMCVYLCTCMCIVCCVWCGCVCCVCVLCGSHRHTHSSMCASTVFCNPPPPPNLVVCFRPHNCTCTVQVCI